MGKGASICCVLLLRRCRCRGVCPDTRVCCWCLGILLYRVKACILCVHVLWVVLGALLDMNLVASANQQDAASDCCVRTSAAALVPKGVGVRAVRFLINARNQSHAH